jgi:hypothetical protein
VALFTSRGSSAATTGTTWANTTNAYDGTAGTNTNTYATYTTATNAAVGTLTVSGYNFSSIPDGVTIIDVSFTVRSFVATTGRWTSTTIRPVISGTPISTLSTATLQNAVNSQTFVKTDITLAQLKNAGFGVVFSATKSGTQSSVASLDFIDVIVEYGSSIETWKELYL